jgi:hypothetical protein
MQGGLSTNDPRVSRKYPENALVRQPTPSTPAGAHCPERKTLNRPPKPILTEATGSKKSIAAFLKSR